MNKENYLNILKGFLQQGAEKMGIIIQFKFYQDNDLKHTAATVQSWLPFIAPKFALTCPVPPPNLNPIENCEEWLGRWMHKMPVSPHKELK